MATCAIKWCGNSKRSLNFRKDGITFHRFPQCADLKKKWIDATRRGEEWFPTKNSVICSRHFEADTFIETKLRRRLLDSAMPTLHLPILINAASTTGITPQKQQSELTKSSSQELTLTSPLKGPVIPSTSISMNTPSRKRAYHRLADSPSAFDSPMKKSLCRRILELKKTVECKNLKLRKLRDSRRILKKKIVSLKSLLAELEKKVLISTENAEVLNYLGVKCSEIMKRQIAKSKSGTIVRKKYSPQLRAFALTLNFYSTKAYNYVRKTFNTCLPSIKTLGKWYQSVDGRPGFTREAFNALKLKADQSESPIYCCIVFDEMKIRSKIEKTFGFVDFGVSVDTDRKDECTDALVYLVVPLNGRWKVPIGYFLIQKVTAEQKVFLLKQAIELCAEANIVVKAVTCDGCPANTSMAKKLGCILEPKKIKSTFHFNNQEIAMFLDPAHMLKLIRNAFEVYGEFEDVNGDTIKWKDIEILHKLQEEEKFHAANKLKAEHLFFKKNIMKVKLATQLFSRSVALALLFCKDTLKLKEFENVDGIANMLLKLNDLFDILDSKVHAYGYKRAINKENSEIILARLEECKTMLMSLTTKLNNNKIRLIESPRYTGFIGMCICIGSVKFLFNDLVLSEKCQYISFHRISQDHLELFFSNMRSHGGANNNPTPKQFYGTYRKMLVHMELQEINTGNCIPLENISILNCSSAIQRINLTTEKGDKCDTDDIVDEGFIEALQQINFSQFSESIIEYIAGAVVHYLIKKIKCNHCVKALVSLNEKKDSLIHIRDVGGLLYPSAQVTKICRRCEKVIRSALNSSQNSKIYYSDKNRYVTLTLRSFVNEDLFFELNMHQFDSESSNHIIDLTKTVIEKYIDIRLLYLTRKTDPKASVRRIYTKLIHFKNQ